MVRLWAKWKTTHLWLALISIPVWYDYEKFLKGILNWILQFQFQYGTIMRITRMQEWLLYVYFNSSMVRLWAKSVLKPHVDVKFQFQYGTIMSIICCAHTHDRTDFNSSMVRLWVWTNKSRGLYIQISIPVWYDYEGGQKYRAKWFGGFQFQYGTIMR